MPGQKQDFIIRLVGLNNFCRLIPSLRIPNRLNLILKAAPRQKSEPDRDQQKYRAKIFKPTTRFFVHKIKDRSDSPTGQHRVTQSKQTAELLAVTKSGPKRNVGIKPKIDIFKYCLPRPGGENK